MKHKSHGSKLKTGGGEGGGGEGEEEEGEVEERKKEWKQERKERQTTVPPLSTTSLAQTLDRYSATLLNIIMLMFGECRWLEKWAGMRNIILE